MRVTTVDDFMRKNDMQRRKNDMQRSKNLFFEVNNKNLVYSLYYLLQKNDMQRSKNAIFPIFWLI